MKRGNAKKNARCEIAAVVFSGFAETEKATVPLRIRKERAVRIIAGEFKGRVLRAPKGSNTRPTTDRVREALFSALSSARGGFEGAVVLDAFAGSGALSLEALSRGAACAHLFERDRAALERVFRAREALYREAADLRFPVSGAPEDCADRLLAALAVQQKERSDLL